MTKPARQPAGTPVGGQFASEHRDSAQASLASTSIELARGQETTLDGDGGTIIEYTVRRTADAYEVSARTRTTTASYLLNAEGTDEDTFAQVMTGPRWREMTRFLESRYPNTQMAEDGLEGDEIAFDVETTFNHAPTDEQIVEASWSMAARIANETDRGTFNSLFVGTELTGHLDAHVFVDTYPIHSGGRWWPDEPTSYASAMAEAQALHGSQHPVSDASAQALTKELSEDYAGSAFSTLSDMGCIRRGELEQATTSVRPEHQVAADALATWSAQQPTTTDLMPTYER